MSELNNDIIAVVGLGYVGLPLAVEFGKQFRTIGFDLSEDKIVKYKESIDPMGEVEKKQFQNAKLLSFTHLEKHLAEADIIIICVPTPIDTAKKPDLSFLKNASSIVGKNLKKGAIVVYESTVYPGITEEVCVPIIEQNSLTKWKEGFFVGYSPERMNPGDQERTVRDIVKVVAGDCEKTTDKLCRLYSKIVPAGIHRSDSIRTAEAAKVIENAQRDLNIAFMNELAIIFDKLHLDTSAVLRAASTKWNFLPFKPGLVGGHCIGVDPYYLLHRAQIEGYHPEIINAGRRINDAMPKFIADQTIKNMINAGVQINKSKVGILGVTFKENCNDIRNSKVFELAQELKSFGCTTILHDPLASSAECSQEYDMSTSSWETLNNCDCLVLAVPHAQYLKKEVDEIVSKIKERGVLIDINFNLELNESQKKHIHFWRL